MHTIGLKRIYEAPDALDGLRLLVERLWPRGVSKDAAHLDRWLKDIAPSTALRRWYGHVPARWPEFRRRYYIELAECPERIEELSALCSAGPVTLIYAARDRERNSALALRDYLIAVRPRHSP